MVVIVGPLVLSTGPTLVIQEKLAFLGLRLDMSLSPQQPILSHGQPIIQKLATYQAIRIVGQACIFTLANILLVV